MKTITAAEALGRIDARTDANTFERRFGRFGENEQRGGVATLSQIDLAGAEWKAAGDGTGMQGMSLRGHAAVFDRLSLDLGYFQETVDKAAFDKVLATGPHVTLNYMHDDTFLLGSTRANDPNNGSLELRVDQVGLRFYSRVVHDPATGEMPSYANDIRMLMQAGIVQQASFCFTVASDEWLIDSEGNIFRTILEVGQLFDVCVCPMGAYPQTDSEVVRQYVAAHAATRTATGGAGADGSHRDDPTTAALQEAAVARQRELQELGRRLGLRHAHQKRSS